MDESMLNRYILFHKIFDNRCGTVISYNERAANRLSGSQYTYGEIEFAYFLPAILIAAGKSTIPSQKRIFWDLGCGTGRALVAAAMSGRFDTVCGVELLAGLAQTSQEAVDTFQKEGKDCGADGVKFTVLHDDMGNVNWSDGDVIYLSSTCFPEELMRAICKKTKALKSGTRIISLKALPTLNEDLRPMGDYRVKMSWGTSELFIYERK